MRWCCLGLDRDVYIEDDIETSSSSASGNASSSNNTDGSGVAKTKITQPDPEPIKHKEGPAASTNKAKAPSKPPHNPQETAYLFPDLVHHRLDESEVLLTRKISSGAFGVVWLGHFHGRPVAVKKMIHHEVESQQFAKEIITMARLSHPKIVHFVGCFWTNARDLAAVTEYMAGGDLRTLLENNRVELCWKTEKIAIAIDIAQALQYLHSLAPRIIHRDLKSRNVLMTKKRVAKLSDFGLSRNRTYEETLTAGVGTVRWTAPEVMLGEDYSEQADIYSYGVVLSELDTREIPFESKSTILDSNQPDMAIVLQVAKGELKPKFSEDCPPCIDHIAKACLQFDPALRPTASKLVTLLEEARIQLEIV